MAKAVQILLVIISVILINAGFFFLPMIHFAWTLSGYEVVKLIPRWVGREFYLLMLIPFCSTLLLFCTIPIFNKRIFKLPLLILLDSAFLFSLYEIIRTTIHAKGAFKLYILVGYYLITIGTLVLNLVFFRLSTTKTN